MLHRALARERRGEARVQREMRETKRLRGGKPREVMTDCNRVVRAVGAKVGAVLHGNLSAREKRRGTGPERDARDKETPAGQAHGRALSELVAHTITNLEFVRRPTLCSGRGGRYLST